MHQLVPVAPTYYEVELWLLALTPTIPTGDIDGTEQQMDMSGTEQWIEERQEKNESNMLATIINQVRELLDWRNQSNL